MSRKIITLSSAQHSDILDLASTLGARLRIPPTTALACWIRSVPEFRRFQAGESPDIAIMGSTPAPTASAGETEAALNHEEVPTPAPAPA